MEEIRTIEALEKELGPLVDDGRTAAAVALVNSLDGEQSNMLSVRLVEMLVALPNNDDAARQAIKNLFADQPYRIAAQLVLARHTRREEDIFPLKVMIEGIGGAFVLDQDVKRAVKELVVTLNEAQEPPTTTDEASAITIDGPAEVAS